MRLVLYRTSVVKKGKKGEKREIADIPHAHTDIRTAASASLSSITILTTVAPTPPTHRFNDRERNVGLRESGAEARPAVYLVVLVQQLRA